jgi:hypothetical protein
MILGSTYIYASHYTESPIRTPTGPLSHNNLHNARNKGSVFTRPHTNTCDRWILAAQRRVVLAC